MKFKFRAILIIFKILHHPSSSGTAKQFVTDNYAKMLAIGVKKCQVSEYNIDILVWPWNCGVALTP